MAAGSSCFSPFASKLTSRNGRLANWNDVVLLFSTSGSSTATSVVVVFFSFSGSSTSEKADDEEYEMPEYLEREREKLAQAAVVQGYSRDDVEEVATTHS